jgi:hypothetical protein
LAIKNELDKIIIPVNYRPTLITGVCSSGADFLVTSYARSIGWNIRSYLANWVQYGKRAGPLRNKEMIEKENPQLCQIQGWSILK